MHARHLAIAGVARQPNSLHAFDCQPARNLTAESMLAATLTAAAVSGQWSMKRRIACRRGDEKADWCGGVKRFEFVAQLWCACLSGICEHGSPPAMASSCTPQPADDQRLRTWRLCCISLSHTSGTLLVGLSIGLHYRHSNNPQVLVEINALSPQH